jgi:protein-disulfide isomerase
MKKLTLPINNQDHIKGPRNAPVQVVAYGDYQCSYCGGASLVVNAIERSYSGQIAFVFRHFPLSNLHPFAEKAAIAAEAAGRQGKFWFMHNMIFQYQEQLNAKTLLVFAEELQLNIKIFKMDITDHALSEKVAADLDSGAQSGVNGTPSFFINGYKYSGSYDFESLAGAIWEMLVEQNTR